MQWRLAIVEELIKGGDNLIRAAHIRMGTYKTTRPITKLYPLEVSNPDEMNSQKALEEPNDRVNPIVTILVVNLILVNCTCHQFYKGICKTIFVSYVA